MQLTSCFFVSSNFFFLEVVEKSLITSESQIVFSKFFVNCLLMYYFEYCIESALKDLCGACYCICLLVALRVPEMCFWPAKIRKNIEFFEVRTCHWPGAQIWFRHKWKKLVTASVLLYCVEDCNSLRYWNEFFLSCVSSFRSEFSRIALWRKRLQLDSRSDLTTNGLIFWFFVRKWLPSLTSYLCGLKSARIAFLFYVFDDIKFFRCLVWGALLLFFKNACTFLH